MRFTFNWLKNHLSTELSIEQVSKRLTSIGIEVENFSDPDTLFKNFKLARIVQVQNHPNADKLKLCSVIDSSGKTYQIVCGAPNVAPGLTAVLAMPGAIIPYSGVVLKKSKIRGIESEGMMCSHKELALPSEENDSIIDLGPNVDLSESVGNALGLDGGIIDVSITPNRGDCLSVKGIARDLAAAGVGEFLPCSNVSCPSSFEFPITINYENSDGCKKYAPVMAFRVIRGIDNSTAIAKIKNIFMALGQKSISPIVDLANLFMMDCGRPLHVYDLNKIEGEIAVRFANPKEEFIDLSGNKHQLLQDMMVSADNKSVLCLLGIMGSQKVACDKYTTDILLESALFDPIFISRTGAVLNLTSDSRSRFERGVDRDSCFSELENATKLILDFCGGTASNIIVLGKHPDVQDNVTITKSKLRSISGCDLDWNESRQILKKLGLRETSSSDETATFLIPSWRCDLSIEEDLVEEVLRISGYDNVVEKKFDTWVVTDDEILNKKRHIFTTKKLLAAKGLSEVISYSFIKAEHASIFDESGSLVQLLNPINTDMGVMRSSLIPNLIVAAIRSLHYGQLHVEIFEIGNVFCGDCSQNLNIAGLRAGVTHERSWAQPSRVVDLFDAKSDLLVVLDHFGIDEKNVTLKLDAPSYYHPSRSGVMWSGKRKLGYFGELHPKINKLFGIAEKLICFEFLRPDIEVASRETPYNSKVFPKIARDFAFLFKASDSVGSLLNDIYKLDAKIIRADIFDCFEINCAEKSIGLSIVMEAADRTLTEEEAQEVSEKVINYVKGVGGKLRGK
ncbi:MAG: phenylalanine--tRNA ligase subunit beta [Holosporaceae bacterium]|jgi:phenylalanyl-tRNA synthetase beta chain|nr:phenylalanine--tRNA ligase subunit beta [Holosporaceae bacterium]